MELRALAYFVTVCRSVSLADAARRLGVAVSTLSAVLKGVERDLGLELFHRRNNALYPNGAARAFLRAAEPLLIAEQFAVRRLATPARALRILRVEIQLTYTIGGVAGALRRAIDAFGAEQPDVLVDPVWTDERDRPAIPGLTEGFREAVGALVDEERSIAAEVPFDRLRMRDLGGQGQRPVSAKIRSLGANASRSLTLEGEGWGGGETHTASGRDPHPNPPPKGEGTAEAAADAVLSIAAVCDRRKLARSEIPLIDDEWVFALRLPAGTLTPPSAAELLAGRLIVPHLSAALIDAADRYFSRLNPPNVRFVDDHPGDLPRLIDERPDAALFVPRTLVTPRLGLQRVAAVQPDEPLRIRFVARAFGPADVAEPFARRLAYALTQMGGPAERPTVSLRQIHYAGLVRRLRRIASAARAANVSQPALSEQIQKLEAALGGALFERQGDGVIPTARGDRFAEVASLIERRFQRLAGRDEGAPAPGRRIVVGILPSVSQHGFLVNRITEAILSVHTRHPGLKLVVQEAPNGVLQDWVTRDLVGVAIVETTLPHMPRLPLGSSEALAAIAHPVHNLLPPGPITLADLARRPLVLPTSRSGLRQLVDAAADERGLKIRPVMEIDALPMAVAALARMPVCTVLPPSAIANEIANGDLVVHPIVEPSISRRLFLIYSAERGLTQPERDLVNALRKSLAGGP